MKKKVLILFFAATILASMTACGQKKEPSSKVSVTEEKGMENKSSDKEGMSSGESSSKSSMKEEMPSGEEGKKSAYQSGEEILNKVFDSYEEDKKFPVEGGDIENPTFDKAAAYDMIKKENIDQFLGLSSDLVDKTDAIASMTNQLNANFFTSAASHVKEGTDMEAFAKEFHEYVKKKQWICGAPDTFLVIKVDDEYIITIFGKKDFTETFKEKALAILEGSEVLLNEG